MLHFSKVPPATWFAASNESLQSSDGVADSPFWYRLPSQVDEVHGQLADELSRHGCKLVHNQQSLNAGKSPSLPETTTGLRPVWTSSTGENLEADTISKELRAGNYQTHCVYSFAIDEVCESSVLAHSAAVEWNLMLADLSSMNQRLSSLTVHWPLDVDSVLRLKQRVQVLRNSVGLTVPIGIAVPAPSIISNMDIVANLPLDFVTVIAPSALLGKNHAARSLVDESLSDTMVKLQRAKKAVGRESLKLVLQANLENGYEAASMLAMGADAVVLNGKDWFKGLTDQAEQMGSLAASFLGGAVSQRLGGIDTRQMAAQVSEFFQQYHEAREYLRG